MMGTVDSYNNFNPLAAGARLAAAELIDAHGPFNVFSTWTLKYDLRELTAHRLLHRHLIKIAQLSGQHCRIGWSWGWQRGGRLHFHGLVGGLDQPLDSEDFVRTGWPGDVESEPPRDQVDSALYLAKRDHTNWMLNVVCPRQRPCRRHGCIVAGAPWPSAEECCTAWN